MYEVHAPSDDDELVAVPKVMDAVLVFAQPAAVVAVAVYVMFDAIPEAFTVAPVVEERYVPGLHVMVYGSTPPTMVML